MLTSNQRDILAGILFTHVFDLNRMSVTQMIEQYEVMRKMIEEKDILRGDENEGSNTNSMD